jgi:hypothetical protein
MVAVVNKFDCTIFLISLNLFHGCCVRVEVAGGLGVEAPRLLLDLPVRRLHRSHRCHRRRLLLESIQRRICKFGSIAKLETRFQKLKFKGKKSYKNYKL